MQWDICNAFAVLNWLAGYNIEIEYKYELKGICFLLFGGHRTFDPFRSVHGLSD